MSSFKDLRIVDNFYQTSSYYPMPTVMISTLAEDGSTSVGSYSLCFPYYIAGKSYYAMILEARNSSNTAQHLLAGRKQVAINFMPEGHGYHKKIVAQGWPGDTPAEKMKNFGFRLEDGLCIREDPSTPRPKVVKEAYQVMECTWMSDLENADEDIGRHFWFAKTPRLVPELLPIRNATLSSVRYAADRTDPTVHFTDDALEKLLNVPRIFLPTVLKGCVAWAKDNGITEITAREMDIINDKRAREKGKTK